MKKENLEHIFKEKFQDFETTPPDHLWENISKEIAPKKSRKKIIPIWYIGSGIAASLLLFYIFIFNSLNNNKIENIVTTESLEYCPDEALVDNIITSKANDNNEEITLTNSSIADHKKLTEKTSLKNNHQEKTVYKTSIATTYKAENPSINNNYTWEKKPSSVISKDIINKESKNNEIAFSETQINTLSQSVKKRSSNNTISVKTSTKKEINDIKKLSDTELTSLILKSKNLEKEKKEPTKKWSIQPQIGTFIYNNISDGSSINSNISNNQQNITTDISYGVRIAYQATSKINIRTGINNANINITTSNIATNPIQNNFSNESFTFNDVFSIGPDSNNIDVIDNDNTLNTLVEVTDDEGPLPTGEITQQIEFVEIPLEVAYKILDKKIGVDLIGGLSTFILTKNTSVFKTNNNSINFTELAAFNKTSFSVNIGFSTDYSLTKTLKFSIEPVIKYQFNSFENSADFNPFFLGVSSGVKWIF